MWARRVCVPLILSRGMRLKKMHLSDSQTAILYYLELNMNRNFSIWFKFIWIVIINDKNMARTNQIRRAYLPHANNFLNLDSPEHADFLYGKNRNKTEHTLRNTHIEPRYTYTWIYIGKKAWTLTDVGAATDTRHVLYTTREQWPRPYYNGASGSERFPCMQPSAFSRWNKSKNASFGRDVHCFREDTCANIRKRFKLVQLFEIALWHWPSEGIRGLFGFYEKSVAKFEYVYHAFDLSSLTLSIDVCETQND